MKRELRLLDQVSVAKPCSADWNAMQGDETKKFCLQCQKHVHNLSAMTAEEAEALLQRSEKLCVRYSHSGDKKPITLAQKPRGFALIAASLAAVAALFGCKIPPKNDNLMGDMPSPTQGKVAVEIVDDQTMTLPVTPPGKEPKANVIMGKMPNVTMGVVAPSNQELGEVAPQQVIGRRAPASK